MNYREKEDPIFHTFVHLDVCFILNTKDQFTKFDSKVDKGIFLGYPNTSKAYKVFNTRTLVVEESIHVKFNDRLTFDRKLLDLKDDFEDM